MNKSEKISLAKEALKEGLDKLEKMDLQKESEELLNSDMDEFEGGGDDKHDVPENTCGIFCASGI